MPQDIRASVPADRERFYRELMGVTQLPGAPEVALKILALTDSEASSVRELASVVARDQVLAAGVLQLANSAFFALRSRLTSIVQAVTLLGFARVRDIALTVSVWNALEPPGMAGRCFQRTLWAHSAAVATTAKALAERVGADPAQAYTAGLLHDVGKLALWSHLGERYRRLVEETAANDESVSRREESTFGCDHALVGGSLLQLWGLPPSLVAPVSLHHAALEPWRHGEVSNLVVISDTLVNGTDLDGTVSPTALRIVCTAAPGIVSADGWRKLHAAISTERDAVAAMFESGRTRDGSAR